jgi:hypothetical protein
MSGAKVCRPICRLDTTGECAAGRSCKKLMNPDYKIWGACLPM